MAQKLKHRMISEIKNGFLLLLGSIIIGLSYVLFLAPNKITAGGVGGIAIILYHTVNIPIGWSIFIINIPLFLLGIKFLGKMYGIRTLVGIALSSFFVDLFDGKYFPIFELQAFKVDLIIAALFGGVMIGAGLGIMFRGKGSSGGSDIIAQIIGKYTSFTPGMAFMFMDIFVIIIAGLILGQGGQTGAEGINRYELIFYGIIVLYISSRTVDLVLQGFSTTKSVQIISIKTQEIRNYIHSHIERGATVLKAKGSYTNIEKEVVFCVVSRKEVTKLKEYIEQIDPDAFMIISDTHQVLGY
ncbi:MAG: YitT family protein, partial [Spirochaetota bacterium]